MSKTSNKSKISNLLEFIKVRKSQVKPKITVY
jgi:hypothetical protein